MNEPKLCQCKVNYRKRDDGSCTYCDGYGKAPEGCICFCWSDKDLRVKLDFVRAINPACTVHAKSVIQVRRISAYCGGG